MSRRPPQSTARRRSAPRRDRRQRRERNRRKPDILGTIRFILVVWLMVQCVRVAFVSPRLHLRTVQVFGSSRLTPEEVAKRGRMPLGENIFRCNLVKVADELRKDPVIRDAVVTRILPDTLQVHLEERQPALQVVVGTRRYDADREGVVYQQTPEKRLELPQVWLLAKDLPSLGHTLPSDFVTTIWECVRLSEQESLKLQRIRRDASGELWLTVSVPSPQEAVHRNLDVRIGRATDLPEKFRDVRHIVTGRPDLPKYAQYLNVMAAGRPAYKLLDPSETEKTP